MSDAEEQATALLAALAGARQALLDVTRGDLDHPLWWTLDGVLDAEAEADAWLERHRTWSSAWALDRARGLVDRIRVLERELGEYGVALAWLNEAAKRACCLAALSEYAS